MSNMNKKRKSIIRKIAIAVCSVLVLALISFLVIWYVPPVKIKVFKYIFESGEREILRDGVDATGLVVTKDIAYIDDGNEYHLLDVYKREGASENDPVIFHIHGGGLFASKKETNEPYCYEWAREGYNVVSISYRLIPDTTLWDQIDDCMAALRYVDENSTELGLNFDECYILGDSAGALLSYYTASINGSEELQSDFGLQGASFDFDGMGLVSIMLETQRDDLMSFISGYITDKSDEGMAYYQYLLDPSSMVTKTSLPTTFFVTGDEDIIQSETYKLYGLFRDNVIKCDIKNYPVGESHTLEHVFAVKYPDIPEAVEVRKLISDYWK